MDLVSRGLVELGEVKAVDDWPLWLNGDYVSAINLGARKAFQEPADGAALVNPKFDDSLKLPVNKKSFVKGNVVVPENLVAMACA